MKIGLFLALFHDGPMWDARRSSDGATPRVSREAGFCWLQVVPTSPA